MDKKIKTFLGLSFLFLVGYGVSSYADSEVRFAQVRRANEEEAETTEEVTNTNQQISFTDENNNSIPDEWEQFWDNNISSHVFGVSLGAIIGVGTSALGAVYTLQKYKSLRKSTKATVESAETTVTNFTSNYQSLVDSYKDTTDGLKTRVVELVTINEDLAKQVKKLADEIKIATQDNADLTEKYSQVCAKLDTVLQNQTVMADIESKAVVVENAREALGYGREENEG